MQALQRLLQIAARDHSHPCPHCESCGEEIIHAREIVSAGQAVSRAYANEARYPRSIVTGARVPRQEGVTW